MCQIFYGERICVSAEWGCSVDDNAAFNTVRVFRRRPVGAVRCGVICIVSVTSVKMTTILPVFHCSLHVI
jgi:hypothetical protein